MNKIWNMINRIKGRTHSSSVKHLSVNNDIITDKSDIANTLANQIAHTSFSGNCSPNFLKHKHLSEKRKINFTSCNDEYYNRTFSEEELKTSLNRAHDTAEGPDKIHYQLLKYKKRLLLRCIHHFNSDLINNMDHMRISGTKPSSVILSQTKKLTNG